MRYILAFALLLFASMPMDATACSCARSGVQQELDQSARVFLGRVASVEPRTPRMDKGWLTATMGWIKRMVDASQPVSQTDFPYNRVTFSVSETFKGSLVNYLIVTTAADSAACGYKFEAGKEYVVYAHGTDESLRVSLCSRTGPLSDSSTGLSVLRNGS